MKWFLATGVVLCALAQSPYEKWLNEDAAYLIDQHERQAFQSLTVDEERERFIEQFWGRRGSQFKEEHYRRMAYANQRFAAGMPGWKTDRGRIYIVNEPPDEIESHPSGAEGHFPYEIWRYPDETYEFVDPTLTGEFRQALDADQKRAPFRAHQFPRVEGFRVRADFGIRFFGASHTRLTLEFETPPSKVYGRVTDGTGRVVEVFEDTVQADFRRRMVWSKELRLAPGAYRLRLVVTDAVGSRREVEWPLEVPKP